MEQIIIKFIIKIGLSNPNQFLKILAKLEYGVAIFCFKLSKEAEIHDYVNLAHLLKQHAIEERKHGKMLSSLSGKKFNFRGVGRWLSWKSLDTGIEVAEYPDDSEPGKQMIFTKSIGIFSNLDGLSRRYYALKILFGSRTAASFSWIDRLAFMCALEAKTHIFYAMLSQIAPKSISAIALQISEDETQHSDYLKYALASFTPLSSVEIDKWRSRINWAMWGLLLDVWKVKKW